MPYVPIQIDDLSRRVRKGAQRWHPGVTVSDLVPLQGGASSLTYRAHLHREDGPEPVVVKVAPAGLSPTGNRDVLRQALVLDALSAGSRVPVPEVVFRAEAESELDPPFFVMTHVPGECFEPLLDPVDELPSLPLLQARAHEAATLLAHLHAVDPDDLPLPDGDRAAPDLAAEVGRWHDGLRSQVDGASELAEHCAAELLRRMPSAGPARVVHGDYRLGNLLCEDARVNAVIDWEIWAIDDPRHDLAWLCTFTDRTRLPSGVRDVPGLPSEADLTATYQRTLGRPVEAMAWFHALASFKQGAVTALLVKNNRRRTTPDPFLESIAWTVNVSLQRAVDRLTDA